MCLWDFVAKTEKAYRVRNSPSLSVDGHTNEETTYCLEDEEAGNDNEPKEGGGHKHGWRAVEKFKFLPDHKEWDRKQIRLCERDVVPVPVGPALPWRDQPDGYTRYCRLMLILFKLWQVVTDLRSGEEPWEVTFNELSFALSVSHQSVVNNMQVLHECWDSRNDHMQTRFCQHLSGSAGHGPDDGGPGSNVEEVDMSEVLGHLKDIDHMSSRRIDEANHDALECLNELTDVGFFETLHGSVPIDNDPLGLELLSQMDDSLEDEWRDMYDKRKAVWKLEVNLATINQITEDSIEMEEFSVIGGVQPTEEDMGTSIGLNRQKQG